VRPRSIQGVPGLDPKASPFERFTQFVKVIAQVSKVEADREVGGNSPTKPRATRKPVK
jgi:hypothetical protein